MNYILSFFLSEIDSHNQLKFSSGSSISLGEQESEAKGQFARLFDHGNCHRDPGRGYLTREVTGVCGNLLASSSHTFLPVCNTIVPLIKKFGIGAV